MQTFEFEELSEQAKDKVRDWYADDLDAFWAEPIIEHVKEEGIEHGFDICDIYWSGFSSQGDGASWDGAVDTPAFLKHHLKPDNPHFARYTVLTELLEEDYVDNRFCIYSTREFYCHSGTMRSVTPNYGGIDGVDLKVRCGILAGASVAELFVTIDIDKLLDHLTEWALKEAKNYADDIYKQLEKGYDYELSDENIQALADNHGWRFSEDGTFQ